MILLTNDLKSRLRRNARAIIDMNEQNKKENRADELTDFGFSKVKEADKEKQVKAVFDQVAPKYDLMNDILSFGMHRLWKQYAIDRAEIKPGMKVWTLPEAPVICRFLFKRNFRARARCGCRISIMRC